MEAKFNSKNKKQMDGQNQEDTVGESSEIDLDEPFDSKNEKKKSSQDQEQGLEELIKISDTEKMSKRFWKDEEIMVEVEVQERVKLQAQARELAVTLRDMALNYQHGRGVSKDLAKAASLYQSAMTLDYTHALNNLNSYPVSDEGITKEIKKAEQKQSTAEQQRTEHPPALAEHHEGEGAELWKKQAEEHAKLEAKAKQASETLISLANHYLYYAEVGESPKRVLRLYQLAIDLGNTNAQVSLDNLLESWAEQRPTVAASNSADQMSTSSFLSSSLGSDDYSNSEKSFSPISTAAIGVGSNPFTLFNAESLQNLDAKRQLDSKRDERLRKEQQAAQEIERASSLLKQSEAEENNEIKKNMVNPTNLQDEPWTESEDLTHLFNENEEEESALRGPSKGPN